MFIFIFLNIKLIMKEGTIENIERHHGHFNYPAFVFSFIYLFFNGKKKLAIILLIFSLSAPYILPILAAIIGPAAYLSPLILVNIYSCAIGNKIAWEHNNCSSEEDFFESQKKWKIAALVLTVIVLLGFIFLTL